MKPFQRSTSLRKLYRRTPSGKISVIFYRRKDSVAKCSICKRPLRGSMDSSSRQYGGYLCHKCLSMGIKLAVRGIS
ncbi:MAG: 50S ribosomal protein L34e [Metallosphaera yellowstonensis]|uniref:Large ribosomal subunit protein eL34 n=1 Tax=Metallosphaera yellowstonensis MK1 TaxID=671065 RepID=H2C6H7_9CREN|nr:50S ribosomal protein L34e [Metallosphaera yellowstonensis]EHP69404.1 ribosomal protein L34E [Metallosphaera yellowstonensis MK1]